MTIRDFAEGGIETKEVPARIAIVAEQHVVGVIGALANVTFCVEEHVAPSLLAKRGFLAARLFSHMVGLGERLLCSLKITFVHLNLRQSAIVNRFAVMHLGQHLFVFLSMLLYIIFQLFFIRSELLGGDASLGQLLFCVFIHFIILDIVVRIALR